MSNTVSAWCLAASQSPASASASECLTQDQRLAGWYWFHSPKALAAGLEVAREQFHQAHGVHRAAVQRVHADGAPGHFPGTLETQRPHQVVRVTVVGRRVSRPQRDGGLESGVRGGPVELEELGNGGARGVRFGQPGRQRHRRERGIARLAQEGLALDVPVVQHLRERIGQVGIRPGESRVGAHRGAQFLDAAVDRLGVGGLDQVMARAGSARRQLGYWCLPAPGRR